MASIDLAPFDDALRRQEEGVDVPIVGMDGKTLTGLVIRVAGPDSERARRAREELQQDLVEAQRLTPLSPAESATQGSKFLAKLTLGWAPKVKIDGKEIEHTEANALRLYERYRFIRQQVDTAAGNRSAFMAASSSSSATPSDQP